MRKKRFFSALMAFFLAVECLLSAPIPASADTETEIVPITEDKTKINGLSLTLDGDIGLVYHVSVPTAQKSGYMVLEKSGEQTLRTAIRECPRDKNGRYTVTQYLSAVELSEPVTLSVYDQSDVLLATKTKTAEDYANALLADRSATAKEKKVAQTLINYGHYAQRACAAANGWEIGIDVAETAAFYPPSVDASVFAPYVVQYDGVDLLPMALALRLDYRTGILLYFAGKEPPVVTVNGNAVALTACSAGIFSWVTEIEGVNALHLEDEYIVSVDEKKVTLCAFSYGAMLMQDPVSGDTMDAMKALYEFYDATCAYFAQ